MNNQEFIEQLSKLVSFKTVTGNFDEAKKSLDYVVSLISEEAEITRLTNNGFETLIASSSKIKTPDIAFLVHIDVVSAKPEQFSLIQDGDKLFGRGVSDMKFSIPMGVVLLNKIIKEKIDITFSLIVTTDEEIGGFNGALFLAKEFGIKPKCLIVPDGGDNLVFVNKAKGVCQLEILSVGSPAHSSRPWEGKNAINSLVKLANELLITFEKNGLNPSWETTLNIGQIEGGVSINQVCAKASMKLDFRYPETTSFKEIEDQVKAMALAVDPEIQVKKLSVGMPTFTDVSMSLVQRFLCDMNDTLSQKIVVKETYGASDARHFAELKIPVLMIKPIGGNIHSDTEWISLSSCSEYMAGLIKFIDSYEKN